MQIREVWNDNLEDEFAIINRIVDDYPYVAMDTEFPGIIFDRQEFDNKSRYMKVRDNVNGLKLIQLGLSLFDEQGNLSPSGTEDFYVWQFNFRDFDVDRDRKSLKSIQFLRRHGINFGRFRENGVDIDSFAQKLMSSGLVLNDYVHWVTFDSKYDFGYLLKALTGKNLPETSDEFFQLMNIFFPVVYDVRFMINDLQGLRGGLERVAGALGLRREGMAHHAGPDSLLTCRTFRKLREIYFPGSLDRFRGIVFGLNNPTK